MPNSSVLEEISALLLDFQPLPEDARAYFLIDAATILKPLAELEMTRLRPSGVQNAARLMLNAANGETERRHPISVSEREDGKWNVVDGNSTFAVALFSGWIKIPCKPHQ